MLILTWCYFITLESAEGVGAVGWGCDHFASQLYPGPSGEEVGGGMGGRSLHLGPNWSEIWAASLNHVNKGKTWAKDSLDHFNVVSQSVITVPRRDLVFQFGKATIHKSHTYQILFCFVFESRFVLLLQGKRHLTSLLVIAANEVTSERKKRSQAMEQLFFRFSSTCFNSELTIAHKLQSFDHAVPPEPWRMRAVPRKWQVPWSLPSPEEHTPRSWLWSKLLQPYTSCTIVHQIGHIWMPLRRVLAGTFPLFQAKKSIGLLRRTNALFRSTEAVFFGWPHTLGQKMGNDLHICIENA